MCPGAMVFFTNGRKFFYVQLHPSKKMTAVVTVSQSLLCIGWGEATIQSHLVMSPAPVKVWMKEYNHSGPPAHHKYFVLTPSQIEVWTGDHLHSGPIHTWALGDAKLQKCSEDKKRYILYLFKKKNPIIVVVHISPPKAQKFWRYFCSLIRANWCVF